MRFFVSGMTLIVPTLSGITRRMSAAETGGFPAGGKRAPPRVVWETVGALEDHPLERVRSSSRLTALIARQGGSVPLDRMSSRGRCGATAARRTWSR